MVMTQENLTKILGVVKSLKGHETEARPLENKSADLYPVSMNSDDVYCHCPSDCSVDCRDCHIDCDCAPSYCRDCRI